MVVCIILVTAKLGWRGLRSESWISGVPISAWEVLSLGEGDSPRRAGIYFPPRVAWRLYLGETFPDVLTIHKELS
jgi:hypothetical protein